MEFQHCLDMHCTDSVVLSDIKIKQIDAEPNSVISASLTVDLHMDSVVLSDI